MIFRKYFYPSQSHSVSLEPIALVSIVARPRNLRIANPRPTPLLISDQLATTDALLAGCMIDGVLGVDALGLRSKGRGITR